DPLGRAVSVPALELRDSAFEASDLHLVAHAAPTERPVRAEPTVEVSKLAASGIELGIGWRVHRRPLYVAVVCADGWQVYRRRSYLSSSSYAHSRQTHSPSWSSSALRAAGTIVTPQAAQIGGRSSASTVRTIGEGSYRRPWRSWCRC